MSRLQAGAINTLTGLGSSRDKAMYWQWRRRTFNDFVLEDYADAYCHNDLVHNLASRVPEEMLSRGYEIKQGEERRTDLEERLEEINANAALLDALIWERLFGGSALLPLANDGRPKTEPLDMNAITSVTWVTDLERRDISGNVDRDEILRLRFSRGTLQVHKSRLILFKAASCPRQERLDRQGWGVGAVEFAWDEILAFEGAWKNFRHLLEDGNQAVYGIKNLVQLLSTGGYVALQTRMEQIDKLRSVLGSILLDADGETFERKETKLTGYADALQKTLERFAMAVRTPMNVLVGTSSTGLGSTGVPEMTLWYDQLEAQRKQGAEKALLTMARMVAIADGTDPENLTIEWPPFWQATEAERADVAAKDAATATATIAAVRDAIAGKYITEQEGVAIVRAALGIE